MFRKRRNRLDGPPKYKPPPPNRNKSTNNRDMTIIRQDAPPPEERPLQNERSDAQNSEPVTDLDAYYEDENVDEAPAHYYAGAPSGWDDPGSSEGPPPYLHTSREDHRGSEDHRGPGASVDRGGSFISDAMFV